MNENSRALMRTPISHQQIAYNERRWFLQKRYSQFDKLDNMVIPLSRLALLPNPVLLAVNRQYLSTATFNCINVCAHDAIQVGARVIPDLLMGVLWGVGVAFVVQLNEKFPDVMMSVQKLPPKKPFGSLDASLIGEC